MRLIKNIAAYTLLLAMVTLLMGKSLHMLVHDHSTDTSAYTEHSHYCHNHFDSHSHSDNHDNSSKGSKHSCPICDFNFSPFIENVDIIISCSIITLKSATPQLAESSHEAAIYLFDSRAPPVLS